MNEKTVRFYGATSDLIDMEKYLSEHGFCIHEDEAIEAACASAKTIQFIEYIIGSGLAPCVIAFLHVRGKRAVSRSNSKIVITGYSAKDAEAILKSEQSFKL